MDPSATPPPPTSRPKRPREKDLDGDDASDSVKITAKISSLLRIAKFAISPVPSVQPPITTATTDITFDAPPTKVEKISTTCSSTSSRILNKKESISSSNSSSNSKNNNSSNSNNNNIDTAVTKKSKVSSPESTSFLLVISKGSVVDFQYFPNKSSSAIVNAANEGCVGGSGVDGAIGEAGGDNLYLDRWKLPIVGRKYLSRKKIQEIRCHTGNAVLTGPGDYGDLHVPFVIHAVGPNYWDFEGDFFGGMGGEEEQDQTKKADELLRGAYMSTLERAKSKQLESVAFSLLSAGIFRGRQSLKHVLRIAIEAICDFGGYDELKEVHMCAFSNTEAKALLWVANEFNLVKH